MHIHHHFFVLISDENDSPHLSSTSVRQRKLEKTDIDETDDFVQIPPISKELPYHKNKDSTKVVEELTSVQDQAGHPVIFRTFFFLFFCLIETTIIGTIVFYFIGKFCTPHEHAIRDDFSTIEEVNQAVKDVGLVRSQLIFGIDYTISNLETGKHSFNGLSLHHIEEGLLNPYQSVR